jgi:hypothetical protein
LYQQRDSKLVSTEPDVYQGVSCKRWRLKSERKESKFGISSKTLRDVELWIDADFALIESKNMLFFGGILQFSKKYRANFGSYASQASLVVNGFSIAIISHMDEPATGAAHLFLNLSKEA